MPRFLVPFWYALLISFTCSAAQNQAEQSPSQLPPSTDIDPALTEQFRQIEQQFADAILHKDSGALERFVGPEYALRISDGPQSSLPRAIWMDNSLHRLHAESVEQRDYAARKLTPRPTPYALHAEICHCRVACDSRPQFPLGSWPGLTIRQALRQASS